jgi:hypothetical protein
VGVGEKIPVGLGFKGEAVQLKRRIVVTGDVDYISTSIATDE